MIHTFKTAPVCCYGGGFMCRYQQMLAVAAAAFGAGILVCCLLGASFGCVLLGAAALAAGILMLIRK